VKRIFKSLKVLGYGSNEEDKLEGIINLIVLAEKCMV
jgi:hypothetical protein